VDLLARIGVVVLLFQVGLESTIRDILRVGTTSLLVALLGIAAPFGLGWLVGAWLLWEQSWHTHAFLGATLAATSVGITARVLQDMGQSRSKEARIILGAAVVDDVLGLIILASISGIIVAAAEGVAAPGPGSQALIALKAAGFLGGSLFFGALITPKLFSTAARLKGSGVLIGVSLAFCFLLSYLSGVAGLAPIVGAFAAGLILEPVHFQTFGERGIHHLEEALQPISELLAPVFFVQMGAKVDLLSFASVDALLLALLLTAAAIAGKQACSLGVLEKGIDRWAVGFGMIPRGEVGLIFAGIGAALVLGGERIIGPTTYAAVVIMVIVTTLISPPLLKWSFHRKGRAARERGPEG
jgi:Kef-type K+ transport system membrane component KefB